MIDLGSIRSLLRQSLAATILKGTSGPKVIKEPSWVFSIWEYDVSFLLAQNTISSDFLFHKKEQFNHVSCIISKLSLLWAQVGGSMSSNWVLFKVLLTLQSVFYLPYSCLPGPVSHQDGSYEWVSHTLHSSNLHPGSAWLLDSISLQCLENW